MVIKMDDVKGKMRFAIGTDKYQHLHEDIINLLQESVKRGHETYWFEFDTTKKKKGQILVALRKVTGKVGLTKSRMVKASTPVWTDATQLDLILIRKSPPQSTEALELLGLLTRKVKVINNPRAITHWQSKKYLMKLKDITAPTYYSTNPTTLKRAIDTLEDCVVKIAYGYGGFGVSRIQVKNGKYYMQKGNSPSKKIDLYKFLRQLTNNGKTGAVVVKFLRNVSNGDKRILVIDGKAVGSFTRFPGVKKGWICNVSSGGSVRKSKLTKEEKIIVKKVVKFFRNPTPEIIGIDTLENDDGKRILSEVNSSSVWGMSMVQMLDKKPIIKKVMNWLEREV